MPKRKQIRLEQYDYSQNGAYFITVCTKDKQKLFWDDKIFQQEYPHCLSEYGKIVYKAIEDIPVYYSFVEIETFVVMPNHIHLLLIIENVQTENGGRMISAPTKSLSTIIGQLKRNASKTIGNSIWQKSFYDHIIRDENDFLTKWNYIVNNPLKWGLDEYY